MSRTMKRDGTAWRIVTKHMKTGEEVIFGPFSTIGAAKARVHDECYRDNYNYDGLNEKRVQIRQWFIEKTEVAWVEIPLKLIEGEWVEG